MSAQVPPHGRTRNDETAMGKHACGPYRYRRTFRRAHRGYRRIHLDGRWHGFCVSGTQGIRRACRQRCMSLVRYRILRRSRATGSHRDEELATVHMELDAGISAYADFTACGLVASPGAADPSFSIERDRGRPERLAGRVQRTSRRPALVLRATLCHGPARCSSDRGVRYEMAQKDDRPDVAGLDAGSRNRVGGLHGRCAERGKLDRSTDGIVGCDGAVHPRERLAGSGRVVARIGRRLAAASELPSACGSSSGRDGDRLRPAVQTRSGATGFRFVAGTCRSAVLSSGIGRGKPGAEAVLVSAIS